MTEGWVVGKAKSAKFDGAALGTRIELLRELRDMSLQDVAGATGLYGYGGRGWF